MRCIACHTETFRPLPNLPRSMMSDGRIIEKALAKEQCVECGLIRHASPLSQKDIFALYGTDYRLPSAAPEADLARAEAYCKVICSALPPSFKPDNVLDVGSGSGALLRALGSALAAKHAYGVDPAGQEEEGDGYTLKNGLFEDHQGEIAECGLIISVNTLEHVADPIGTIACFAEKMSEHGIVVLICPTGAPSNVELLFYDHIWSYSPRAFAAVARNAGLAIQNWQRLPEFLGDFQMMILRREGQVSSAFEPPEDNGTPEAYLERWQQLDGSLMRDIGDRACLVFGAGQMAALLRCYTPRVWARAKCLIMDNPDTSWLLGDVRPVPEELSLDNPIVIGTHPRHHSALAARIAKQGGCAIRFDDKIER